MTTCPIDGGKLGIFSSRELRDGTICKKCANKVGLVSGVSYVEAIAKSYTIEEIKQLINQNEKVDKLHLQKQNDVRQHQAEENLSKIKKQKDELTNSDNLVEIGIPEHVILSLLDSGVQIERKGIRSFSNRGKTGAHFIPFQSITSVEFKPAGFTHGQITFHTLGGEDKNSGLGSQGLFAGGVYNNNNAILFSADHNAAIEHIKTVTESKMGLGNTVNANNTTDSADELRKFKQLADDGIITQDEFEQKKKQLLGLN